MFQNYPKQNNEDLSVFLLWWVSSNSSEVLRFDPFILKRNSVNTWKEQLFEVQVFRTGAEYE